MSETNNDLEFHKLSLNDNEDSEANVKSSGLECDNTKPKMTGKLEAEAFKSINVVGYQGPLLSENVFKKALEEGPKSIEYTKLINYLTNELRIVCNIDECVNAISTPEDSVSFIMETSSFLNELGCPYASLTQGHVTDRLSTILDRILLVQHLAGELMAARIIRENRPEKKIELKLQESSQAADLRKVLQTLGFPKPPANITMQTLMQKLLPTVQNTVQKAGSDLLGNPIFNGTLSEKQWETLADVQQDLHEDYRIRREMLLKRLDCTIQSFQWSDKTKGKEDLFNKTYSEKRKLLKAEPEVDLSDLLASRDDLAIIEKTSSALVRKNTKSAINKVIIGQVPDRGGRTSEQAPPPPEMPPWQQRSAGPSGGGGGFRGGHQAQRGGSNYSRGGGQQSSYGGGNNFSQGGNKGSYNSYSGDSRGGGNKGSYDSAGSYGGDSSRGDFSRGGNDYSRGSSDYSRGGNDYSRGSNEYARGSSDYSRGSGGYSQGGNDYSRGASSYSQGSGNDFSRSSNDYSKGSYSQGSGNYSQGSGSYSQSSGGYSQTSGGYSQGGGNYSRNSGGYPQGGNRGGFDSAGGYGGYSQEYQEPKRAKTYDQFQQNKTTYADQYVQESQHNQQYHPRDNRSRGSRGGRSNYNRGGGGGGYR